MSVVSGSIGRVDFPAYVFRAKDGGFFVTPKRDATAIIYLGGIVLILLGLMNLAKGETIKGGIAFALALILIIQRIFINRRRNRA